MIGIVAVVLVVVLGGMYVMKVPPFAPSMEEGAQFEQSTDGTGGFGTDTSGEAMETPQDVMTANTVEIQDYAFNPPNLTVKAGTTVTFVNKDAVGHSATADDGSFDTGVMIQNESGTVTFDTPGTFGYHCTPHPNMKGTVIVE